MLGFPTERQPFSEGNLYGQKQDKKRGGGMKPSCVCQKVQAQHRMKGKDRERERENISRFKACILQSKFFQTA